MSCVMAWQGLDLVGVLVSVGTAAHSEELSVYLALGVFLTFQPLPMGAPPPHLAWQAWPHPLTFFSPSTHTSLCICSSPSLLKSEPDFRRL